MKLFKDWDEFYMSMAFFVALKSKDPSTKTGAIIVNKRNRIVSFGINGIPSNVQDDVEKRNVAPTKYSYYEHAERNAIYNTGSNLENCRIYVNWFPCHDCARAIIQTGINELIYDSNFDKLNKNWGDSQKIAREMLLEANINVRKFEGVIKTNIEGYMGTELYDLKTYTKK